MPALMKIFASVSRICSLTRKGIIDTVIVQYGIQTEPSAATKIFIPQFEQMMSGDEFTFIRNSFTMN